jgi:F0F1-type ATP synthase membrane subunit b/b'
MPRNETTDRRGANGSGDGSRNAQAAVKSAVDEAKGAVDEASGAIGEAASGAREAVNDLASEAQTIAAEAGDKARSFVEENKGRAAEQISGITSAIGKAADELDARGQGQFAKYTRDLVSGLEGFSRNLNEKGVDELMSSVGQFARNQPAAFLGAAALLGFVSSRFAMSTAKPQPQSQMSPAMGTARGADYESQGDASYLSTANGPAHGGSALMGDR